MKTWPNTQKRPPIGSRHNCLFLLVMRTGDTAYDNEVVPAPAATSKAISTLFSCGWGTDHTGIFLSFWSNELWEDAWRAYGGLNQTICCYIRDQILGRAQHPAEAICPGCSELYCEKTSNPAFCTKIPKAIVIPSPGR